MAWYSALLNPGVLKRIRKDAEYGRLFSLQFPWKAIVSLPLSERPEPSAIGITALFTLSKACPFAIVTVSPMIIWPSLTLCTSSA